MKAEVKEFLDHPSNVFMKERCSREYQIQDDKETKLWDSARRECHRIRTVPGYEEMMNLRYKGGD
jgi:hypothetical protein